MELTFAAWILTAGVIGVGAYVVWGRFGARPSTEFDAGVVSQSWLTDHNAGKSGDRFS